MCQEIHQSVATYSKQFLAELSRYNYVTPTSYLELLGIFSKLIGMKKMDLTTARRRLKTGLDKVRGRSRGTPAGQKQNEICIFCLVQKEVFWIEKKKWRKSFVGIM